MGWELGDWTTGIGQREDCHLDSAGKEKDENSHSTFILGSEADIRYIRYRFYKFAVVFTRRTVSRISKSESQIDDLVN